MLRSLTREAGINKRIYPHLFRHTRATYLAKFLPEAVVKEIMGWVQDSKSAARYVHLSGRDVDKALLRLYGIVMDEDGKQKGLEALTCARCGKLNSPTSTFCKYCGMALDIASATRADELKQKADALVSALMNDEKILDRLLEKVNELRSS